MMRATWQGFIALGRLGIPVKLYPATQPGRPQFVQLHEKDHSPIERVLFCREENREIRSSELVRGIEYKPGEYVTLTDKELERTAPSPIKTIAVKQFCDTDAVDPLYYEKPYYVVPSKGGKRAYSLMREVFTRIRKMAITQYLIYNKERLGALRVHGDMLILNQPYFAGAITPRSDIKPPPLPKPGPKEIDVMSAVVERYSSPFYAQDYHDEHTEQIEELIVRKIKGLRAPVRKHLTPHATPEDQIVPALKDALEGPAGLIGAGGSTA